MLKRRKTKKTSKKSEKVTSSTPKGYVKIRNRSGIIFTVSEERAKEMVQKREAEIIK